MLEIGGGNFPAFTISGTTCLVRLDTKSLANDGLSVRVFADQTTLAACKSHNDVSNLTIGTYTLDQAAANPANQTYAFGQPTGRVAQTFGSGGPRALQVAARITF